MTRHLTDSDPEAQRAAARDIYRAIFEHLGMAAVLLGADTIIRLANRAFERMLGIPRAEIEGRRAWTEFVHPLDVDRMLDALATLQGALHAFKDGFNGHLGLGFRDPRPVDHFIDNVEFDQIRLLRIRAQRLTPQQDQASPARVLEAVPPEVGEFITKRLTICSIPICLILNHRLAINGRNQCR